MQKMQIKFLGQEDLGKETATPCSIFARSLVGYKRAGHDLVTKNLARIASLELKELLIKILMDTRETQDYCLSHSL